MTSSVETRELEVTGVEICDARPPVQDAETTNVDAVQDQAYQGRSFSTTSALSQRILNGRTASEPFAANGTGSCGTGIEQPRPSQLGLI
jgi:hypothetical protein